jgi:hypothetical protein
LIGNAGKREEGESRPEREDYIRKVLEAYIHAPETAGQISSADRKVAEGLFRDKVPLGTVEAAIAFVCVNRLGRDADDPPLEKVRSLAYFHRTIKEFVKLTAEKKYGEQFCQRARESLARYLAARAEASHSV